MSGTNENKKKHKRMSGAPSKRRVKPAAAAVAAGTGSSSAGGATKWSYMDLSAPENKAIVQAIARNTNTSVADVNRQLSAIQRLPPSQMGASCALWIQKMESIRHPETTELIDEAIRYIKEGDLRMVLLTNQKIFDLCHGRAEYAETEAASTTSTGGGRHE